MVYFLSDVHLGLDLPNDSSSQREQRLVNLLDQLLKDATEHYLLGDIFDYWFEFRNGTHPEHGLLFSAFKKYAEKQVPIYLFCGNHDLWLGSFFLENFNIRVIRQPIEKTILGKSFYLAHGDGIGNGDIGYKILKGVFTHPLSSFLFGFLPYSLGISIMKFFSNLSRKTHADEAFDIHTDRLFQFCSEHSSSAEVDYYIMGHRHLLLRLAVNNRGTEYINLGDWLKYDSYASFDGTELQLISMTDEPILTE